MKSITLRYNRVADEWKATDKDVIAYIKDVLNIWPDELTDDQATYNELTLGEIAATAGRNGITVILEPPE